MARLYVVRTGQTTFQQQDRVCPATGAPLTARGVEEVQDAARQLGREKPGAIYASNGAAESQTAALLGAALRLKVHAVADLREIDYGLWQGLKLAEIKRRQPKVYRQWADDPTSIRPPGGEGLAEAQERICDAIGRIIKRHPGQRPLVVLSPVAMELLRCVLEGSDARGIWQRAGSAPAWSSYETDNASLQSHLVRPRS